MAITTQIVTVRMDAQLVGLIDRQAQEDNCSRGQLITRYSRDAALDRELNRGEQASKRLQQITDVGAGNPPSEDADRNRGGAQPTGRQVHQTLPGPSNPLAPISSAEETGNGTSTEPHDVHRARGARGESRKADRRSGARKVHGQGVSRGFGKGQAQAGRHSKQDVPRGPNNRYNTDDLQTVTGNRGGGKTAKLKAAVAAAQAAGQTVIVARELPAPAYQRPAHAPGCKCMMCAPPKAVK